MSFVIRKIEERDYKEVEVLTREAFWNIYRPGCSEHLVLHNIHKDKKSIEELHAKEKELQTLQDELKGKLSLLQLEEQSLEDEGETIEKNIEISKEIYEKMKKSIGLGIN